MFKSKTKCVFILTLGLVFLTSNISIASTNRLDNYPDKAIVPDWAKLSFDALLRSNIISGYGDGTLKPNNTINRAELAKILVNATNQNLITPRNQTFPDVSSSQWFFPYIETAHQLGWISGYPDGTFKPGNTINRAEVSKLLTKSFILNVNTNQATGAWYTPYVNTLEAAGLLPYNIKSNQFGPATNPTRAEVFEQIYRSIRADKNYISQQEKNPNLVEKPASNPYDIAGNFTIKMAVTSNGTLDMKRPDYQAKRIDVNPGQTNVSAFSLEMVARKSDINLSEIKLRRIGNGTVNDFGRMWLEMNGQRVTNYTTATEDIITFNFLNTQTLPENQLKVLKMVVDLDAQAKVGHSHRFLLYLPDWLNADTNQKIGLFPYGGSDVYIID